LYVGFGGRFGLEFFGKDRSPRRRNNDVYEDFYRSRNQEHYQDPQRDYHRQDSQTYRDSSSSRSGSYGDSSYYQSSPRRQSSSWWDGMGGTGSSYYSYMAVVAGVTFVANRFGISPYQAMFFVNMLMGRRGGMGGRFMPRRGYGGGFGGGGFGNVFGGNGFGGGFGNGAANGFANMFANGFGGGGVRRNNQFRHRPGGMWG